MELMRQTPLAPLPPFCDSLWHVSRYTKCGALSDGLGSGVLIEK